MQRSTPKNRMEMRQIVPKNNRGRWEDLQKNRKQDKEVGINPDFDEAEAGIDGQNQFAHEDTGIWKF